MSNIEQKQEQKTEQIQAHESFESWLFSEENQSFLWFFLICVTFTIWYAFHISNMAVDSLAHGGF